MSVNAFETFRDDSEEGIYYGIGFTGYAVRLARERVAEQPHVDPEHTEESCLAPAVADWDKTLFERDVARQAMRTLGVDVGELV
jgi:hypothetical protein